MSQSADLRTSRRDFLKTSGKFAAASALAGVAIPNVHAADSQTVKVALVGCGGRGTGAVGNALSTKGGPIKLVAMADVFENKLKSSFTTLKRTFAAKMDVPEDQKFLGFDAYKNAIDCLQPGDVAIFATPPAFRWVHFTYAIQKGVNVFMEKPVTVDGPTSRRMFKLADEADKKNMKVGVGLMVRHCRARQELLRRIKDGAIGEIILLRAYRMHGPVASAFSKARPGNMTDLMYQIQRFHSFLWASGGLFSDFYIHQVDECCWMKEAWPVQAHALGGRHYRGDNIDQNFDLYSVEYTFHDGTKFFMEGRTITGCHDEFSSYAQGTKGLAIISKSRHTPGQCAIFKGHNIASESVEWRARQPEANPYDLEWEDLLDAIRNDKPYNEVKRGVTASLVTSMGRMAAHTGQIVTYEDILNSDHEFAPNLDKLTAKSDPPVKPDREGKYPVPMPGINTKREY
ncbi:MAG TPA: Gfo/Idh/MocA family oxidoreductase [Verrucomicrobiae bacterium]|nr:Gfo/Idh/MocA family oxidoreductase [Verrucomicrobiae bacterium]